MHGRTFQRTLLVLLLLALARFVWLALYVQPYADDLSYAAMGMRTELFGRLAEEYRFWNGRYFSNLLVLRGPLVLGLERGLSLYRLVPVALLLISLFALWRLIRVVTKEALGPGRILIAAVVGLGLYLHLMPQLSEGIYWYTGSVTYQLASALMLLWGAMMIGALRSDQSRSSNWSVGGAGLLILLIAGSNELAMVYLLLLSGAALFLAIRQGRAMPMVTFMMVLAVGCAITVVLAPGNAVRSAYFPNRHDVWLTASMSVLQTGRFAAQWLLDPALIVASLLFLQARRSLHIVFKSPRINPWLALSLPFLALFLAMVLPYWATGLLGQYRTVNAALWLFLPLWFLALWVGDARIMEPRGWRIPLTRGAGPRLLSISLVALLLFSGQSGRVTMDLLDGTARDYAVEMDLRHAVIARAVSDGAQEVRSPQLLTRPRSLDVLQPGADPTHWLNTSLAQYFGNDGLRVIVEQHSLRP